MKVTALSVMTKHCVNCSCQLLPGKRVADLPSRAPAPVSIGTAEGRTPRLSSPPLSIGNSLHPLW